MAKSDSPPATNPLKEQSGPSLLVPAIIVALAVAIRFVPGWVAPFTIFHFISLGVGPLLGVLALLVWWVVSRRLPRRDRWLGLLFAIGLLAVGFVLGHRSMPQVLVGLRDGCASRCLCSRALHDAEAAVGPSADRHSC